MRAGTTGSMGVSNCVVLITFFCLEWQFEVAAPKKTAAYNAHCAWAAARVRSLVKISEWAKDPEGARTLEGFHYLPPGKALALSLSARTHHLKPDKSLHKKSENTCAPGSRQEGELGTCRPGNSSSEVAGLRLPAWETGE